MNSEKLGNALVKSKDIAMNLLGNLLSRTHVEPMRDAEGLKGLKASWVGDRGERVVEINTPTGNTDIKMDGHTPPTIEYMQEGEKRTIAVNHIKNFSCELNRETLDRIATPKGAAIAMCVGAGIGLIGWFLVTLLRAVPNTPAQQDDSRAIPTISEQ